ncbi:tubby C-terminal-like domain-containing protein [Lasiosphaeria hispida]|uniref:Tubby C-terminal-like domain-containing protein n=1 Tax=Lasiosphaeria hispida TaxID=260671 RepID=A0AAJ0MH59_9PEZI|nr:tubby C-terminal-like domain-containing protein [Lasiosphaeria hispida]
MAFQLAPLPQALGVFAQFTARQTETLVLREKVMSLSGDSFEIKLQNGQPVLRVQGKVMSISGRKSVYDMAGTHLFDIVKEHLHIHATYAALDPSGRKLLEVKSSFALLGSKATATFTNATTGTPESLQMKGNWFDSAADIVDLKSGATVGRIDRKLLSGRDILFGQQTYALTVAPGADMALMVAMCICMDEKNNESKSGFF